MKVYKQPCALCGANNPEILFPASYKKVVSKHENIVICKNCGLVYKYPIVPERGITHYMNPGHWTEDYYDTKLGGTAEFVAKHVPLRKGNILDIGAAAGHLLNHLSKQYPKAKLTGVEPSENACKEAVARNNKLTMVTATIEDAVLPENSFDLITAIGVDYLFLDHVNGLIKISKLLSDTGRLYIERNVFLDSKAYVSKAIKKRNDLFGTNTMMKNWFTKDQMVLQLSKFFDVVLGNCVVSNIIEGHKNIHYGWICRRQTVDFTVTIPNSYKENKNYILKNL
jgi:trans-aconitate methyltransferase